MALMCERENEYGYPTKIFFYTNVPQGLVFCFRNPIAAMLFVHSDRIPKSRGGRRPKPGQKRRICISVKNTHCLFR